MKHDLVRGRRGVYWRGHLLGILQYPLDVIQMLSLQNLKRIKYSSNCTQRQVFFELFYLLYHQWESVQLGTGHCRQEGLGHSTPKPEKNQIFFKLHTTTSFLWAFLSVISLVGKRTTWNRPLQTRGHRPFHFLQISSGCYPDVITSKTKNNPIFSNWQTATSFL